MLGGTLLGNLNHAIYFKKKIRLYQELELMTLIPVLVASREAASNGSNIGLNATVNAQSTICPATNNHHP